MVGTSMSIMFAEASFLYLEDDTCETQTSCIHSYYCCPYIEQRWRAGALHMA